MSYKPVDAAIVMTVGPCIDDTDFKALEESIAYDAAGMDISLIVEKTDGTSVVTAITLTTGGTSDWTHKDGGYYEVEITAAQNVEEGIAYLRGVCTGVLPFESPRYDIVKANIYDSWIKGTDNLQVDVTHILGHLLTQTGTQLADGFEKFFDVGAPTGTINSLPDAAPDAAGGLPISDVGGLDLDTKLANTNEITAARMGALTDWINGGRLDLILDIIAADTTTDIPAKLLKYIQLLARSDAAIATDNATELTAINADGGTGGGDFSNQTDAVEALRDRGDSAWTTGAGGSDRLLMVDTTIATLASQTSFTLAGGSADDDAYNNCTIVIEDVSTAVQKAVGIISGYTGATKTVTLKYDPAIFTMATTDKVYILAENALKSTLANRQLNVAADGDIAGNIDGSVASVVGHTAQTGDSFARIGAAGASLSDLGGMSTGMKAEVESEANDALVAQKLDHLVAVADADDPVNDSIIAKMAASDGDWSGFDNATDALEALRDRGDAAWITGGGGSIADILNVQVLIPNSIDLADTATVRIGLGLTNMVNDLPSTDEITPGTITIDRKAIGGTSWTNIVNAAACSELAGLIYYDEVFDSGTGYAAGDSIRVTFKSQKITVAANDYVITDINGWVFQTHVREAMRGTDSANTTVPDAAGVAPTAIEIRQEIDSNSTRLDADISSRAPASEYDEQFEDLRVLIGDGGDVYYVSKAGDNTDGTTWAKAKTTIDAAIELCTANHSDKIYVAHGTYDETANGTVGVAADVEGIKIIGVGMPTVENTDTTANGSVFTVTATNTIIDNVFTTKGETTSDGAICIYVNGASVTCDIRGVMIAVEKTTHTGVKFDGGAIACSYMDTDDHLAHIYSLSGDGVGIEFADCSGCIVIAPHLHDLTTGIYFSGGADCEFNVLSPDTMILNCDTAITLDAGAHSNALSANIVNCTTEYNDNSGNNTNKADASLSYALDDIKTHIQNGHSEIQGAGFVEATDSLEALRDRGDAGWTTATGFNTTTPPTAEAIADQVWDEILSGATHNIATSAGRRLRELGAYHITSGTAQAGTIYGITLAAGESAIDHIFNRNLLVILTGAGAGQTRTIVDYNGTSKIAVVDRDWWVTPDATSEYTIIPDDTPLVADHGLAQAGGNSTITLRAAASSISSTYSDLILFIMAGTGKGQAKLIDSYEGSTRAATIHGTWTTNPDATSVYCMIASGLGHTADFTPEALAKINTECTNATSDIKAKTDNLPSGITKNVALSDFNFYMVLSSDHVTEATGKAVTGTISKDGGAFAALTNSITEIASGMYKVDLTQAEMNADVVTLKFVETDCDQRIITIYTS